MLFCMYLICMSLYLICNFVYLLFVAVNADLVLLVVQIVTMTEILTSELKRHVGVMKKESG